MRSPSQLLRREGRVSYTQVIAGVSKRVGTLVGVASDMSLSGRVAKSGAPPGHAKCVNTGKCWDSAGYVSGCFVTSLNGMKTLWA